MTLGKFRTAVLSAYAVGMVDGLLQSLANDIIQYSGALYRLRARGMSNEGRSFREIDRIRRRR